MQSIDTLILAAHVVPVVPRAVLADHAVAVDRGRIVEVLPSSEALARYEARKVVRLEQHALIPGPGEPALPRRDDADARPRGRPAAHDLAAGSHLARRSAST